MSTGNILFNIMFIIGRYCVHHKRTLDLEDIPQCTEGRLMYNHRRTHWKRKGTGGKCCTLIFNVPSHNFSPKITSGISQQYLQNKEENNMLRRSKGEGSITQLSNGKFRVRLETDPVNGKRHWLTATATTRKEAVKKLQELQRQKEDKKVLQELQDDISILIEPYLSSRASDGLRLSTIDTHRTALNLFYSFIQGIPVDKITKNHIVNYRTEMQSKGLKTSTIKLRLNTVKNFFDWLVEERHIQTNPASTVKLTNTFSTRRPDVLSDAEHKLIKDTLEGYFFDFLVENNKWNLINRLYPLYLLVYESGLREGEIAGLKWKYVDFENDTIQVVSKMYSISGLGNVESIPKTDAGFRCIKISKKTMGVLKELKEACEEKYFYSEYVFGNHKNRGKAYTTENIAKNFQTCLKKAGITRRFTFHGIRHTNASIMFDLGVSPTIIAERLGHSSIQTTFSVYTHARPDNKDRNSAVVVAL